MYTAYFSNGMTLQSPCFKTLYRAVMVDRRSQYPTSEEVHGVVFLESVPGSREIYRLPQGRDVTIEDVAPTVRTYNVLRRKAQELGLPCTGETLTVGIVRQMMLDGYLVNLRNAGTKTYKEIFGILHKYMGWDSELEWFKKIILDTHKASFLR